MRRPLALTRHLGLRVAFVCFSSSSVVQLLFFGGGTTGALTWATTTYVLSMHTVPGKDALLVTTPTLTGGVMETEVAWADITRPIGYHPFATFEANGKKFYLDELGEMFDNAFPEKLEAALNK